MTKYIKPTIQFMSIVRYDADSRVMATEDTADTFNLYLDGVEWTPNIDRGGYVDPQDGEDQFQGALAAARRLIVLTHDMRRGQNSKDFNRFGWHVRCPVHLCSAWGDEPEQALDRLRIEQEKTIAAERINITTQD